MVYLIDRSTIQTKVATKIKNCDLTFMQIVTYMKSRVAIEAIETIKTIAAIKLEL